MKLVRTILTQNESGLAVVMGHASAHAVAEHGSERMSQAPPDFLSTHPKDETRIQDIKTYLPEAMKYYKK